MLPRQAKSGGYKYGRVSGDAPFAEAMDSVAASAATPDFSSQGLAIGKKKGRRPKKTSQDDESKPNPKPTSKRSVEVDTHGPSEPSAGSAPKKRRNGSKGKKVTEEPLPQLSFLFFSVGVCVWMRWFDQILNYPSQPFQSYQEETEKNTAEESIAEEPCKKHVSCLLLWVNGSILYMAHTISLYRMYE